MVKFSHLCGSTKEAWPSPQSSRGSLTDDMRCKCWRSASVCLVNITSKDYSFSVDVEANPKDHNWFWPGVSVRDKIRIQELIAVEFSSTTSAEPALTTPFLQTAGFGPLNRATPLPAEGTCLHGYATTGHSQSKDRMLFTGILRLSSFSKDIF